MTYHFIVYEDERGSFYSECLELAGCRTEADTLRQTIDDIALVKRIA